jgi:hypothetical protein
VIRFRLPFPRLFLVSQLVSGPKMQKSCQFLLPLVTVLAAGFSPDAASAQAPAPRAHNFVLPNDANRQGNDLLRRRHVSPLGKACLTVDGSAKPQTLNPHIFEHWVSATNICGQDIKLQICYLNSQDCISVDVPPYGRKDSVLGIYPALADFQFETKEQF